VDLAINNDKRRTTMATQIKVNPTLANASRSFFGKDINAFTIDLAVNATNFGSTEMGPNGAVQQVLATIARQTTIVGYSALRTDGSNAGQIFDVYVEGKFGTDTYDGTTSETLAAHLEDLIQALTTAGARTAATIAVSGESSNTAGVDLSSAAVSVLTGFPLIAA
jgi:hypothetical protein